MSRIKAGISIPRARRLTTQLDRLEQRRMLSVGDDVQIPLLFLDLPGAASTSVVSPTIKRLDIKATAAALSTSSGLTTLTPPAITEIAALVNNDGTLNGGVAGDDLRVYRDNDNSGNFSAGDQLLLSGEVQPDDFSVANVTIEMTFDIDTAGAWATDPLYFGTPDGPKDAGVQLDLMGPDSAALNFTTGFTGYLPKGVLGSLPVPPTVEVSQLAGRVFNDCDDDGKLDAWNSHEHGIAGVTITLLDSSNAVIATTTTAPDGTYQFLNLPAGTYTVVETQPVGFLDGKDSVGTVNGVPRGVIPPNSNDRIAQITLAGGESGINYNFAEVKPSSLSGYVYIDVDKNCKLDSYDGAIAGVKIELYDECRDLVACTYTDKDGYYIFNNVRPGENYTIVQEELSGVSDGMEQPGNLGGKGYDDGCYSIITCIDVCCGEVGVCYNFSEVDTTVRCGDTASIAAWASTNGQKLIIALNPGLGNWLAGTFPNMYANLAGKTNAQVGAEFIKRYQMSGQKIDAQAMALALAVYATDSDLGGWAAKNWGFTVNDTGLATALYNVGSNGPAFGLAKYATTTVYELLQRTDVASHQLLLFDMNNNGSISSTEQTNRSMAYSLFYAINGAGAVA